MPARLKIQIGRPFRALLTTVVTTLATLVGGGTMSGTAVAQADQPILTGIAPRLPASLTTSREARVVDVVDGDTVVLDDGNQVRLVGTQAPKLSLGRAGFVDWPLAGVSRDYLAGLVSGETVALAFGGLERDRHGRYLAHLVRARDGLWIQGAMLAAGMTRVYSFPDNRAAVGDMLVVERAARGAGHGIWSDPFYAILGPDDVSGRTDTFQVVEGTVVDAATVRGRTYLNFGRDYRTDFTIVVESSDRSLFRRVGLDLLGLEGQAIRVRGWVREFNGPLIEATHPEQIELIDDP